MAENSKIEWTDDTANPWWGCTKVSPACSHCYAETFAKRTGRSIWGPSAPRWIRVEAAKRDLMKSVHLARKGGQPRRVFMCSMADIFELHLDVVGPRAEWWAFLHEVAKERLPDGRPCVVPLILTKRPEVMARYAAVHGWPSNAWAGTTVEDQRRAEERIPHLLKVPAQVRFLSLEPLLGPVYLGHVYMYGDGAAISVNPLTGQRNNGQAMRTLVGGPSWYPRIHWLIIGGESGPHARPMHPEWARSLIAQGVAAGVAVHFKQWGEWAPVAPTERRPGDSWLVGDPARLLPFVERDGDWYPSAPVMRRLGKKLAGRLIDGRTWDEIPEVPHG